MGLFTLLFCRTESKGTVVTMHHVVCVLFMLTSTLYL